jgi:hypothetical protein
MHALGVERQQLGLDPGQRALDQFAGVCDMGFGGEDGTAGRRPVVGCQAGRLQEGIDGVIENQGVVRNIEVTVVIDPLRPHTLAVQMQALGRRIAGIAHGGWPIPDSCVAFPHAGTHTGEGQVFQHWHALRVRSR